MKLWLTKAEALCKKGKTKHQKPTICNVFLYALFAMSQFQRFYFMRNAWAHILHNIWLIHHRFTRHTGYHTQIHCIMKAIFFRMLLLPSEFFDVFFLFINIKIECNAMDLDNITRLILQCHINMEQATNIAVFQIATTSTNPLHTHCIYII